jgi:hypothetical protein
MDMEMKMGNEQGLSLEKFALWGGIGCAGLVIGMIFGCVLSIGGLVWLTEPPDAVTASIDAPIQVDAREKVEFVVNVTNHGEDAVNITRIDVGVGYLKGFTLLSVVPNYDSYYMPEEASSREQLQSYYFSVPIEPGETVSITFVANAVAAGDYAGSLDICINSGYSCIYKVIRTVVK